MKAVFKTYFDENIITGIRIHISHGTGKWKIPANTFNVNADAVSVDFRGFIPVSVVRGRKIGDPMPATVNLRSRKNVRIGFFTEDDPVTMMEKLKTLIPVKIDREQGAEAAVPSTGFMRYFNRSTPKNAAVDPIDIKLTDIMERLTRVEEKLFPGKS